MDFETIAGSPGKYNYVAWVNASVNLTVDLIHSSDEVNWVNLNEEKRYVANTGWKKFVWSSKPGYQFYELDITLNDDNNETSAGVPESYATLEV